MNAKKLLGWTLAAALVIVLLSAMADANMALRGLEFTRGETFFWNVARGLSLLVIAVDITVYAFLWWVGLRPPVHRKG